MKSTRTALVAAVAAALVAAPAAMPAPAPTKLTGVVGPGFTITLTKGGKKVTTLKAGTYSISVNDKSNIHNFHLKGKGVNRDSGVSKVAKVTWTVKLSKGRYTYVCDPHASSMKGSFTVT